MELRQSGFRWIDLRWHWLAVAAACYLSAQFVLGMFWWQLLISMNQQPRRYATFRAFYLGHLGKYVPGKMFTVLLRTGLIRGDRVAVVPAGISVFFETLIYMAVGAFIAAMVLSVRGDGSWQIRTLALGASLTALVATWPPLLRWSVAWIQSRRNTEPYQVPLIDVSTWFCGWVYCSCAWFLNAISLWATIRALPLAGSPSLDLDCFTRVLASVTLAVVAGFASFLPGGGLGVREWMLDRLLAVEFGPTVAVVSAVLLRFVWLLTEIVGSVILYLVKPVDPALSA